VKVLQKATFTGWSCPTGPAELVDYLVDSSRAEEVTYNEFAEEVDISTAPLEATQFECLPTDWAVTWLQTEMPSGMHAWVMQHSGIEYLFLKGGDFNWNEEARLAEIESESE